MSEKSVKQKAEKSAAKIAVSNPEKISKKTIATLNECLKYGYNIESIARRLGCREIYRKHVINLIREIKGEQYLVDNGDKLGYPVCQLNEGDISGHLVDLIEQWFRIEYEDSEESETSEQELRQIIEEYITTYNHNEKD